MRERDTKQKEEINSLREEMSDGESTADGPYKSPPKEYSSGERSLTKQEAIKWPAPYDHKNQNEWTTTHGILRYKYQRDFVDRQLYHPSDFFMDLYTQAVTGTAKSMITGAFQSMLNLGKISDPLGLLKVMDDTFRDRNADQKTSALIHACRQFRDEALSSFLPRYQQLLSISVKATSEDIHKVTDLHNVLNQTTRNHLIGHTLPSSFIEFIEKLSVIGSQIEAVGLVKTKLYALGQTGTFDDGTRGVAGGNLLGSTGRGNLSSPAFAPFPANYSNSDVSVDIKDADGDVKMTGVNKTRARWVSKKEIERRIAAGLCIRCGRPGHRKPHCSQLPPLRPETAVKQANLGEDNYDGPKSGVCKVVAESQSFEDQKAEKEMNGNSFLIDVLINNIYTVPTLIDSGCDCLAAVSNSLVRKANLPRIEVTPRKLAEATDNIQKGELITEMTKMEIDIDGYQKTLYAYIIPRLSQELILGKPWMEREDVLYDARDHFMEIREALIGGEPMRVWEKRLGKTGINELRVSNIASLSAGVFLATVKRAKKVNKETSQIFSVTLADIQKALAPEKKSSAKLEKLPAQYARFADLFKKELIDKLPPHRAGSDHEIRLEPDKEIPWGPSTACQGMNC
ncbi:hypothetical protein K3495_g11254 [Podosphaera aphanis]|nr:hypothetical protein K3495_g11254 [Podosphaera aphanis]